MRIRYPSFAGSWYASSPHALRKQIESCFTHDLGPGELPRVADKALKNVVGLLCPHAGYMYSGPVAAHAYHKLAMDGRPDVIVAFSPNHTGVGSALALVNEGSWRTPLGDVEIDTQIAEQILVESQIVDVDERAHAHEHSIELQLPFLQYLYGDAFRLVPICFLMQDAQSSIDIGLAVSRALSEKNALVIASTDMTHYEPQKTAEQKDKKALDTITKLDEESYCSLIAAHNISTCGRGPTVAAIIATKNLGARKGQLLCYKTSGDITEDFSAVVGYASIAFIK